MNVTVIECGTIDHPRLFMSEMFRTVLGIQGVKIDFPVEDVCVGADVEKSVVHCWTLERVEMDSGEGRVGLWSPESVLRLKPNCENIHKNS